MSAKSTSLVPATRPVIKPQVVKYRTVRKGKELPVLLFDLLSDATPHPHEIETMGVIIRFLKTLDIKVTKDKKNNLFVTIPLSNGKPSKTMFSSHMDTVQHKAEKIKLRVITFPEKEKGFIKAVTQDDKPTILGADDKVGVYIMLKMIEAKIPGYYAFHVGEERGAIGSRFAAKDRPKFFKKFDRCIAFDRRGYSDVIHTQRGHRGCSVVFTDHLTKEMNELLTKRLPGAKVTFKATSGVFTDSAEYDHLISECTNLSVGYFHHHSSSEYFDSWWLLKVFIPLLLNIKWEELPAKREAKKHVWGTSNTNWGGGYGYGGYDGYSNKQSDSRYQTNIPTYLQNTPDWAPLEGWPNAISTYEMKQRIRRWLHHGLMGNVEDLYDHMSAHSNLVSDYGDLLDILFVSIGTLETILEGLDTVPITSREELKRKLEGLYKQMVEDSQIGCEDDEKEQTDNEEDISPLIIFDTEEYKAYISEERKIQLPLYSKSRKLLKRKHLKTLTVGTNIFVKYKEEFVHVHTVFVNDLYRLV